MIFDGDLIANDFDFMTDFNGIKRHFPNPAYPSGINEEQKPRYNWGPESSPYPTLTLPCNLYDEWGNVIQHGYYMVVLSSDMKYLELYQSNRIKARVRVVKLVEQMFTQEELNAFNNILKLGYSIAPGAFSITNRIALL